jgi:hypothetical protein
MIRLIFFGLGLVALVMAFGIWRKNQRFKTWSKVPGLVLSSAVTGIDEDVVSIEYEYTVGGKRHIGRRLNPSSTSTDAIGAESPCMSTRRTRPNARRSRITAAGLFLPV